jgi:hypothetical protein
MDKSVDLPWRLEPGGRVLADLEAAAAAVEKSKDGQKKIAFLPAAKPDPTEVAKEEMDAKAKEEEIKKMRTAKLGRSNTYGEHLLSRPTDENAASRDTDADADEELDDDEENTGPMTPHQRAIEFCTTALTASTALGSREERRHQLFDIYPELNYFVGLTIEEDGHLGGNVRSVQKHVIFSMELAMDLAIATADMAWAQDLVVFTRSHAGIRFAESLDRLLVMLAVSSLCRVACIVQDAALLFDETRPIRPVDVLEAPGVNLPSLARLDADERKTIVDMLRASLDVKAFCQGGAVAGSLRPITVLAESLGASMPVRQLILHDALRCFSSDLFNAEDEERDNIVQLICHFLASVSPLSDVQLKVGKHDAYLAFFDFTCEAIAVSSITKARLFCMLQCCEGSLAHIDDAIKKLDPSDWRELDTEIKLAGSRAPQQCPILLHGACDLLLNCYCEALENDLDLSEALCVTLSTMAYLYRIARDGLNRASLGHRDMFDVNCVNVVKVAATGGAGAVKDARLTILRLNEHGAYMVAEDKAVEHAEEHNLDATTYVQDSLEALTKVVDVAELDNMAAIDEPYRDKPMPLVIISDPGQDQDDEIALVLSRTLSDIGLIDVRCVVANLKPSDARAKLAAGTLKVLDMPKVPVGIGTDGNSDKHGEPTPLSLTHTHARKTKITAAHRCCRHRHHHHQYHYHYATVDNFTKSVEETGHNYMDREVVDEGDELLVRTYNAAEPHSLILLLISSLTDAAAFIRNNEALFLAKVRTGSSNAVLLSKRI